MRPTKTSTVLLLGGTGRTGRLVLQQLLERGANVRAVVRSAGGVPEATREHARLAVTEAGILSLSGEEMRSLLRGCDAVVSCLGHNIDLKGIFGLPRDLVTRAVADVCRAVEDEQPATPVRFVLMSSVSVNRPGESETRRGRLERVVLAILRSLVPPTKDNQRAADYLSEHIGPANPYLQWVAVRPDTLHDGPASDYSTYESVVSSLFRPDRADRANVAHFMCELVQDQETWQRWRSSLPVVINAAVVRSQGR